METEREVLCSCVEMERFSERDYFFSVEVKEKVTIRKACDCSCFKVTIRKCVSLFTLRQRRIFPKSCCSEGILFATLGVVLGVGLPASVEQDASSRKHSACSHAPNYNSHGFLIL